MKLDQQPDHSVQSREFRDGFFLKSRIVSEVSIAINNHTELSSPVTDMVITFGLVPHEIQNSCQRISDDGRSNVPNVQRFGDVG